MPLDAPVTIATLFDSLLIFPILHPERIAGNPEGIHVGEKSPTRSSERVGFGLKHEPGKLRLTSRNPGLPPVPGLGVPVRFQLGWSDDHMPGIIRIMKERV